MAGYSKCPGEWTAAKEAIHRQRRWGGGGGDVPNKTLRLAKLGPYEKLVSHYNPATTESGPLGEDVAVSAHILNRE